MADEHVEFLVIGSGAGGAPLTHTLVHAGRQVLVLEKGPLLRTQHESPVGLSDFKRDEKFATGAEKRITVSGMANRGESFYSSHVEPDLNDEPHVYEDLDGQQRATIEGYTAQVVGGGTQLYGGVGEGTMVVGDWADSGTRTRCFEVRTLTAGHMAMLRGGNLHALTNPTDRRTLLFMFGGYD